ncbi:hypothetical protein KKB99_02440, partial [bacterium]|nr:hypothetical protein [bacterium]MBU1024845.1 hypothetical protein [bacterium]
KKEPKVIDVVKCLVAFLEDKDANFALRMILECIVCLKIDKIATIRKLAFENKCSLWQAAIHVEIGNAVKRSKALLEKFKATVGATEAMSLEYSLKHFAREYPAIASQVNLYSEAKKENDGMDEKKENEDIGRVDVQEPITGYRFLTLQSSKGLDADFVFIPFMEKDIKLHGFDLEEDRRLLYIGLTRARVGVIFTWAKARSKKRHKAGGGVQFGREVSPYIIEIGLSGANSSEKVLNALKARAEHVIAYNKANEKCAKGREKGTGTFY